MKLLLVKQYTENTSTLAELRQIASRCTFDLLENRIKFQTSYLAHQLYQQYAFPYLKASSSISF
jgi:hypothetical protein